MKTRECILVGFYDTENLYQLWDIEAKELIKRRDVIFHKHIIGHPSLARNNEVAPGEKVNILGQQVQQKRTEEEAEELENLYPVIEILKDKEWVGIPERVLSMQEELVQKPVLKSFEKAMSGGDGEQWLETIKLEHDSLKRNSVYKWVVLPKGKKELPCKWLFNIQRKLDRSVDRYKARIVAGGHRQKEGIDFKETFAPVAKFASLRLLLTIVALENLEGEQADIVTAFLYGELDKVVYMKVPDSVTPEIGDKYVDTDDSVRKFTKEDIRKFTEEDRSNGMAVKIVWLLCKSLYRLKQALRCFYRKLDRMLVEKRYTRVVCDYGVWICKEEVVLIVYVDDMQMFGTHVGINKLIAALETVFILKRLEATGDELFLGLRMERDRLNRRIALTQAHYAMQVLLRFGMDACAEVLTPMDQKEDCTIRKEDIPLNEEGRRLYQVAIESLIYLMLGTRPDLSYSVNKLAQYYTNPTERYWKGIKRILRFIKGTINTTLQLGNVIRDQDEKGLRGAICSYFDAIYMDDKKDRHSTMGYAFFCAGSLVSWSSKKQQTIMLSTTEAEYLAGTEASKEAIWIQQFLQAIRIQSANVYSAKLYSDNQGANVLA